MTRGYRPDMGNIPRDRTFYVVDPQGRRYVAYTEREAYHIRDTVGGTIEWEVRTTKSAREVSEDIVDAVCEAIGVDSGAFSEARMTAAVNALNAAMLKAGVSR